jgi:hypothetical protein
MVPVDPWPNTGYRVVYAEATRARRRDRRWMTGGIFQGDELTRTWVASATAALVGRGTHRCHRAQLLR